MSVGNPNGSFSNIATLTGQFPYCSLPLRLDSYRGCGFACSYCFARVRGGNVPSQKITEANGSEFRRIMDRSYSGNPNGSILSQLINRKTPFHFGGMSDPFQYIEKQKQVTKSFLETLSIHKHPVVISTKGTIIRDEEYLNILTKMTVIVQFSISTIHDELSQIIEPYSSKPSEILKTIDNLTRSGVLVTCRWQPFVPSFSESPDEFMKAMSSVGVSHVSFEHLKVPTERKIQFADRRSAEFIEREREQYMTRGAYRDGREYVLPPREKYRAILEALHACHKEGMSFGAADNEFQYLSDGEACCSGVDQFDGFDNILRFHVGCAVRRCRKKPISFGVIQDEWRPVGSVDRFLNSRTRLGKRLGVQGSIDDHIRYRWNTLNAPGNPTSFFGVYPTGETDENGNRVFEWNEAAAQIEKEVG